MSFSLEYDKKFKKDFVNLAKNNLKDAEKVKKIIEILYLYGVNGIPVGMKPHLLKVDKRGIWDIHVRGDLIILLIQITEDNKIILLRVGTHSQLGFFSKFSRFVSFLFVPCLNLPICRKYKWSIWPHNTKKSKKRLMSPFFPSSTQLLSSTDRR